MADSDNTTVSINFDDISRNDGLGNRAALLHSLLRGKNWQGGKPAVPVPEKSHSLLFCTRPDFNMDESNIGGHRILAQLINGDRYSMGSLMRSYLDPRACLEGRHFSDVIDPNYPFFPLLDNTVLSLDGWNELVLDPWVSPEGKHDGAVYIMPTGQIRKGSAYTLSITHAPVPNDLVNETYRNIQEMIDHNNRDRTRDYTANVALNNRSSLMRWYRFGFDPTGNYVINATMCGESYPIAGQIAAAASYDAEASNTIQPVTATWQCAGLYHNDPIIVDEFNRTVIFSNPNMADSVREDVYVRVGTAIDAVSEPVPSIVLSKKFKGYGYPRINPATMEFEIWVPKPTYDLILLNKDVGVVEEDVKRKVASEFSDYLEDNPELKKYIS